MVNFKSRNEIYWRKKIAKEIQEFGKTMDSTIPISENEVQHGEYFLRHWTQYIVKNCVDISEGKKGLGR
jgi:hypothetical protein